MCKYDNEDCKNLFDKYFKKYQINDEIPEQFKTKDNSSIQVKKRKKFQQLSQDSFTQFENIEWRRIYFQDLKKKGVKEEEIAFLEKYKGIFSFSK